MTEYMDKLNHALPMAHARMVRRERYAWPGGYPLALVMDDGGLLCPDCVAAEFHAVSEASRDVARGNGWKPAAILCGAETDEEMRCDHCDKVIQEAWSEEA